MQLTTFVAAMLLILPGATASPAPAPPPVQQRRVEWNYGANCTDRVIGRSDDTPDGLCVFLTLGASARSFSWTGATHGIEFFVSGGGQEVCSWRAPPGAGGPGKVFAEEAGCATAPPGFNWQSFRFLPPPGL